MKKLALFLLLACSLVFIGCKKSSSCWYEFDGGYVNVDQVKIVKAEGHLYLWTDDDVKKEWGYTDIKRDTIFDGPITEESIRKAKMKLKESSKQYSHANASAGLFFDSFEVRLPDTDGIPGGWSNNKDLLTLLDMWLESKKQLDSMF